MERGQKNLTLDFVPRGIKGISNIIVTLIMIVLVLVAVGIVWTAIQNNLETGVEQFELNAECIKIGVKADALNCGGMPNSGDCTVTITRSVGGEAFEGLKLIFTNALGATNYVHTEIGNMAPLATKTTTTINTGIVNISKVNVVPYFEDGSGNQQICP